MNVKFRALVPADTPTILEHLPLFRPSHDVRGFVAYDDNTAETAGIFILNNWTHSAAHAHWIIIKRMVLRHGFLEEMGRYMFDIANRAKVFGTVIETDTRSLSMAKKFGWVEYARMKDGWDDDVDCVLLELLPENCRYWQEERVAA